ncbi:intracellular hyaluronan-binding protein 4 isoform X2 [Rhinoderma darwinii]|uniref:intracellular hyaluronan-binding protein 4 isoform X2 n=1 Tax=Rhinoderma darwinii TaxID=43563 RepID=UPI003F66273B
MQRLLAVCWVSTLYGIERFLVSLAGHFSWTLGGMKQTQGSPVSTTMQEAFGCAVENRFFQLLDDESDPLDFLHQASTELGRKKKKEDAASKKAGNQKGNKKESQKDRKIIAASITEAPGLKQAPKQPVQKTAPNENCSIEMKVERTDRRPAFKEFRPNLLEKPMEYSIDNFEREKQVRNWVANQRGGTRGRGRGGFPRNMDYENQRGKREFERHSGSDKAVKAEDKRGGSGPRNWGSIKDAFSEMEPAPVENIEATDPVDTLEEEQDVKVSEENTEDYAREMSLDEWKSMQDQSRPKAELNIRKLDSSMPSKAVVIHKSKYVNNLKEDEEDDDDYHYGLRKPVNDITSRLDINFGSLPRPGRGARGGGRGRGLVRREEAFPHEVHNVNEFALNPDDPEDFPALI